MNDTLELLQIRFPQLSFVESDTFCWSPETKQIMYTLRPGISSTWSLLHETSHALLDHCSYKTDFELIRLEVAAWEKAKSLAREFGITINENHIQDCLDTYRDWLYSRSICPNCNNKCLQQSDLKHYRCFNCHTTWKVTPSRFCRAYRATKGTKQPSVAFHATEDL